MTDEGRRIERVVIVCDLAKTFLRVRRHLARALVAEGHEVHAVFSAASERERQIVEGDGLTVHVVDMKRARFTPVHDGRNLVALRRLLRRLQPDVLFTYQLKAAVLSSLAARPLEGCRRFVLFPGLGILVDRAMDTGLRGGLRRLTLPILRFALEGVSGVIFQNPEDRETLIDLGLIDRDTRHVVVRGSGVPLDDFVAEPQTTLPTRFLMAGRLLTTKGFREFAEAARFVRRRAGADVEFQIAGPIDDHPAAITRSEVERWIAEGFVSYVGEVSDIRPLMREASVFVLPSYYGEGTPRVILEAMSMSRPVITADSRGCREAVEDGVTGVIVPPRDARSLAAAMEFYVNDRELRVRHGRAGRKLAEERYDVHGVVRSMLDFLEVRVS